MKPGISIIICTYDGSKRLTPVLEHLAQQEVPQKLPWEIVLVDNASTDHTTEIATAQWEALGAPVLLRTCYEATPGKSYAQQTGIKAANYDFLLICDDDNWLAPNYLAVTWELMNDHPEIGILGGKSEPVFEVVSEDIPKWFSEFQTFYAVGKQSKENGDITHKGGSIYGAGMVIRKPYYEYICQQGFEYLLSCRKGSSLLSGGDIELCKAFQLAGFKIWYDDRLKFKHFMTKGRLSWTYLMKLIFAMGQSRAMHHVYDFSLGKQPTTKKPIWMWRSIQHIPWLFQRIPYLLNAHHQDRNKVVKARIGLGFVYQLMSMRGEFDQNVDRVNTLYERFQNHPFSYADVQPANVTNP
ncbi:MAG: glycosyltransferase [Bacteroidota bacterium]